MLPEAPYGLNNRARYTKSVFTRSVWRQGRAMLLGVTAVASNVPAFTAQVPLTVSKSAELENVSEHELLKKSWSNHTSSNLPGAQCVMSPTLPSANMAGFAPGTWSKSFLPSTQTDAEWSSVTSNQTLRRPLYAAVASVCTRPFDTRFIFATPFGENTTSV